jgi:hypothetical protein
MPVARENVSTANRSGNPRKAAMATMAARNTAMASSPWLMTA